MSLSAVRTPREQAGAEPDERRHGVERDLPAVLGDAGQQPLDQPKGSRPGAEVCGGKNRWNSEVGSTAGPLASACARWVSPMSTSRTNGTAASSASKVSALARNGMLFSSAAWSVRRRKPAGERCHPPERRALQASGSSRSPAARRRARASASRRSSSSRGRRRARRARGCSVGGPRPRRSSSSSSEVVERLLAAAELLGELVQLLLGHGPELPQLALETGGSPRRCAARTAARARRRAPRPRRATWRTNRPPRSTYTTSLPCLRRTMRSSYSPASASSSAATSAGLSAA